MYAPESKLQQLEFVHADQGTLEDIEHSNALATTTAETETGYFASLRIIGTIAGLGLALAISYWGFSPPAAVLETINADIGPSDNASLFSIIWSICCAIGILVFGRLSDKFGRRWFVITASSTALVGAIIAATAKTMNTLIVANVFLGLAGGVHTCHGLTVGEVVPNKWKFLGVATASISNILPTGFGAFLGMSLKLVRDYNWRYIYYIFIPCMAFCLLLQFLCYRPPSFRQLHGTRTRMEELRRIDYVGIFLMVAGILLFLLGVSWGGQPLPWNSATIISLLSVGGCIIIVFIFWEIYGPHPNPIVPMYFFKDLRGFVCAIVICSVAATSFVALSIIWPSQVARIYGSTVTSWQQSAWLSTTIAFGVYSGFIFCGPWISIIKHIRIQLIVMMTILVTFTGAMASCKPSNLSRSAAFSFFAGFPAAWLELVPALLIQLESNDVDLGTVYAIIYSSRAIVGSIMTAVYLAILSSKITSEILKYVPDAAVKAGLPDSSVAQLLVAIAAGGTPDTLSKVPGVTASVNEAVGAALVVAYTAAYSYVYYAAIAFGGVGLIACFCMRDYDQYLTNHVPRQIYRIKDRQENIHPKEVEQDPEVGSNIGVCLGRPTTPEECKGPVTTLVE
ncbi:uncharacterized protein Z520_07192 [Fonsecaea multimorphosa CBS 102226]|uniref:Major facilitator superfamily (MFS) profile domain-containing protein n=1 Tax=Fonsecaea multimorphosa CBS 102226 TaxID=1442371 RepID=A0A0D2KKC1_9EURO|nr:uncharacterized protein Z520_07192 [Fonsecaea multimorphosa CBS 102226]KIX97078.1 hypothetical protein Z520_07192 [Fonsecaea multimorphosa CBS 102226]